MRARSFAASPRQTRRARLALPSLLVALYAAGACAATPAADDAGADDPATPLIARGNEPPWTLRIERERLVLERGHDAGSSIVAPREAAEAFAGGRRHAGTDGEHRLDVTVRDALCRDDMSGMPHPLTVEVTLDETETLRGCGGEPAALLRRDDRSSSSASDGGADTPTPSPGWLVESVDGVPAPTGEAPATLRFGADGRLSGAAACNRYFGPWTLDGESLGIGPLGSTRRRCPPPAMEEEARLLDALERVRRFDIDGEGRLVLSGDTGDDVVARPAP